MRQRSSTHRSTLWRTALQIETVPELAPFAGGWSAADPPDWPEDLSGLLFGGPAGRCYAVADAARLPGLADHLEASELRFRCFFKGDALRDLGDAAPWLVEMEPGDTFCKRLLTRGDAPWEMWDRSGVLFLRSGRDFDGLWQHLRKFTRIPNGQGGQSFFRYWEPQLWDVFALRPGSLPALADVAQTIFGGMQVIVPGSRTGVSARMILPADGVATAGGAALRADLGRARLYSQMFAQAEDFRDSYPGETARYGAAPLALWTALAEAVDEMMAAGLSSPTLRARFLILAIVKYPAPWPGFLREPLWQAARDTPARSEILFSDMCALLKHKRLIETWW